MADCAMANRNITKTESRNVEIWGPGNSKKWDPTNQKIKILKIQIRSAQNVGKVWISRKKPRGSHLGPSEAIFSMDRKNQKHTKQCIFSLVGQWALFTRFGVMCWCHFDFVGLQTSRFPGSKILQGKRRVSFTLAGTNNINRRVPRIYFFLQGK